MFKLSSKLLKSRNIFRHLQKRTAGKVEDKDVNIFINGKPVKVPKYFTVLQALRREGVTIPSFCYHERLSIAGNCRMCLVQVEGMFKLQVACGVPVMKDMKINTISPLTLTAQESVLEFLLINHPLDCPICDQGGECDLQDLSMRFGNDRSRFTDVHFMGKRAVEDKNLGPLIRAEMTRCIHCTRCIRFGSQVCGMDVLGTAGRGTDMLVGTYVDKMFLSELSGNIIDLCPVGALTAIPYMFKARPWEVIRTNSIDVTDATGTNIVLNYRFNRLLRVLPREHAEINQEWLSDKGRWAIDSLEMQRLVTPMHRFQGCLCTTEWDTLLRMIGKMIRCTEPDKVMAIAGPHTNVETLVTCKDFLNMLGSEHTYIERGLYHSISNFDLRVGYSLNIKMSEIATADKILLIGTNPRFEAPVLNARIRQAYMFNECDIYVVGPKCDYNYHVNYLGEDVKSISKAVEGMKGAKKPLIFIGVAQLETEHAGIILKLASDLAGTFGKVCCDWNVINFIPREASFAGALEAGWKSGGLEAVQTCPPQVLISLGADEIFYDWTPPKNCIVIYIGFQGDRGAEVAQAILPGSAYTEAGGVFMNMEGRSQFALPALTPPGKARHDWKIVRALAEYSGVCLYYCDQSSLCCRLAEISPNFTNLGPYQEKVFANLLPHLVTSTKETGGPLKVDMKTIRDYYCSDVFSYNSPTMINAQKAANKFAESSYAAM
ncbi:NADH-ubiquinone oxidoreductase 75 kDa subunit, mitochondrial-like [Ostrinia nubilalis]|uniref:NADH-ubiquinone oxidoreductase 75 kDa subunit, mitochondrial-like n=1 Tax=Ostrinia furnacalis TaxID=93504 RepID=UPI00103E37AF|nr:NADH-ubiquinone oxidoreductase 75 kDa subunit, mitochondrial-like [Ostrinia furnacalis]